MLVLSVHAQPSSELTRGVLRGCRRGSTDNIYSLNTILLSVCTQQRLQHWDRVHLEFTLYCFGFDFPDSFFEYALQKKVCNCMWGTLLSRCLLKDMALGSAKGFLYNLTFELTCKITWFEPFRCYQTEGWILPNTLLKFISAETQC